jgi:ABC-type glycerol-3-phosphate transport system permease component
MELQLKKTTKLVLTLTFILLVLFIPMILLYVGTRKSGIDLQSSLSGNLTLEPFVRLFVGTNSAEIEFRRSIFHSIIYSSTVALISIILAAFYSMWVAGLKKKSAIGISFTLMTLVLLPQTYIIMPAIISIQKLSIRPFEHLTIVLILLLGIFPICSWLLYLMSGEKIGDIQEICSLDSLNVFNSMKKIIGEIKLELLTIFLIAWTFSWGNFFVPFSLGSRDSYTAVVRVSSFATHLGKDWAMICAAGIIVCIPGIIIGGTLGHRIKRK